jgi:hypothetical protein
LSEMVVSTNGHWQLDDEGGAFAGFAPHRNITAHHPAEVTGDGQAQSAPSVLAGGGGVRLGEGAEQPSQLVIVHADTGVGHFEAIVAVGLPLAPCHPQGDRATLGELAGVAEEIEQGLPHLGGVGPHRFQIVAQFDLQRVVVLVDQGLDRADHIPHEIGHKEGLQEQVHLARLDL